MPIVLEYALGDLGALAALNINSSRCGYLNFAGLTRHAAAALEVYAHRHRQALKRPAEPTSSSGKGCEPTANFRPCGAFTSLEVMGRGV